MSTAEILSKLTPKTTDYGSKTPDVPDHRWQDILQAMHGVDAWKTAFLLYVYGDNTLCKHGFFSGLFMEIMERPETQLWISQRREQGPYHRDIETMCQLAVDEWKSDRKTTEEDRAIFMGVSRSTWKRKYKVIYETIVTAPKQWEDEVMKIVTERLI